MTRTCGAGLRGSLRILDRDSPPRREESPDLVLQNPDIVDLQVVDTLWVLGGRDLVVGGLERVLGEMGVACPFVSEANDLGILADRQQPPPENRRTAGGIQVVHDAHPRSGSLNPSVTSPPQPDNTEIRDDYTDSTLVYQYLVE